MTRSGGVCHVHAMTCRAHRTGIAETVFVPDTAWRGMRSCSSGVLYKHEQRTQRAVTLAVPNSHLPRKLYICLSASSRRGHRAVVGVRVPGRAAVSSSNKWYQSRKVAGGDVFGGVERQEEQPGELDRCVQADQAVNTCRRDGHQQREGEGADGAGMESGFRKSGMADAFPIQLPRVVGSCAMQSRSHIPVGRS